jgi:hypothetical protein
VSTISHARNDKYDQCQSSHPEQTRTNSKSENLKDLQRIKSEHHYNFITDYENFEHL